VTEPLTPEEEAELRESFAAGMRQDRSATVVFAREDIARLLATLDAARATDEGRSRRPATMAETNPASIREAVDRAATAQRDDVIEAARKAAELDLAILEVNGYAKRHEPTGGLATRIDAMMEAWTAAQNAAGRSGADTSGIWGCHQHGGWHHHGGFRHLSGDQHEEADHDHRAALAKTEAQS